MTYEEALKKIHDNWKSLGKEEIEGIEAVWMINSEYDRAYEVDIEKVGMKHDGSLVWAYASGCSCWDGNYDIHEFHDKEIHAFVFQHKEVKAKWQQDIIEFAEGFSTTETCNLGGECESCQ